MASFGEGLGQLAGGIFADQALQKGQSRVTEQANNATNAVHNIQSEFTASNTPYNYFGQSFLTPTAERISDVRAKAGETLGYDQFMKGYTNTPAAQYQLQQADAVQNNSAAARGGLLSGANLRGLATINNGIVAGNANTAYDEYRAGSSLQFGQLESLLGNMFSAIGVGQTAQQQQASVDLGQMGATAGIAGAGIGATSNLAQASAKNDQSKGSGLGSMFSGLGSAFSNF